MIPTRDPDRGLRDVAGGQQKTGKMGLCKCPKKKMTNQFCFEHATNVCEHCMVAQHSRVRTKARGCGGGREKGEI